MITISKQVRIVRKDKASEYKIKNFKVLGDSGDKKIGGSIKAENAMLVNSAELKSYLPNIIGVSVTDPEWGRKVDNHIRSISAPVEPTGLELEIGFNFDVTDMEFRPAINELIKEFKLDDNEADVFKFVVASVNRNNWWKYGKPINPADYFLWRYCQNYRPVANNVKDADKSDRIRFYIVDTDDVRKEQSEMFAVRQEANKLYFAISDDEYKVKAALFIAKEGAAVLSAKTNEDLLISLDQYVQSNATSFIKIAKNIDKLKDTAFVEECIARGIFTKIAHSNLITDSSTGDNIGGNVQEVVNYLNNPSNVKYTNTVKGIIKSKSI